MSKISNYEMSLGTKNGVKVNKIKQDDYFVASLSITKKNGDIIERRVKSTNEDHINTVISGIMDTKVDSTETVTYYDKKNGSHKKHKKLKFF